MSPMNLSEKSKSYHFCQFARAPGPVDGVIVAVAASTAHSPGYRSPGRSFSCESDLAPRNYKKKCVRNRKT